MIPAAVVLLLALLAGGFYWRKHQTVQLTDKDQLILADFTNQTGDAVFDSTLKEALAIQLEQSPLLQLVSDAELHNNLQYLGQTARTKNYARAGATTRPAAGRESLPDWNHRQPGTVLRDFDQRGELRHRRGVCPGAGDCCRQDSGPAAVSKAATAMRARLGESMASIQKLSTPYTNVTTTSLQAFHAFSLGEEEHRMGRDFPRRRLSTRRRCGSIPVSPWPMRAWAWRTGTRAQSPKRSSILKKAYDLRERVTERERMYIESQYALQQYDLPKALQSYKLFVATYPRDAAAWNNLANAYGLVGDVEQALAGFQKTWEIAKWNNVAANNAAGTLIGMDRLQEGERYMKEAVDQGGSDDTNYHSNAMTDDFLSNRPDWEKHLQWAAARPDGFSVRGECGHRFTSRMGRMHDADRLWEHAGQRAEQQHLPDAAGGIYAVKALHDALVSNCPAARESANRGLAIDHSVATVPDAALALALCGEPARPLRRWRAARG